MIEIPIPGYRTLRLAHLILDYNGTLACDGGLLPGVTGRLSKLAEKLYIHVVTADTFGDAAAVFKDVACTLHILPPENQDNAKLAYAEALGLDSAVCIGNGRNDRLMIAAAALGVAVVQQEGAAPGALTAADAVCPDINAALDLLLHPLRLTATLRS